MIASFATDTLQSQTLLASITDSTVDYDIVRYGRKQYPIGRYSSRGPASERRFRLLSVVTTVGERDARSSRLPLTLVERFESRCSRTSTPRHAARRGAHGRRAARGSCRTAPCARPVGAACRSRATRSAATWTSWDRLRAACTVRVCDAAGDLV
ncbi:MAG: hypothetical protein IPJ04_18725, partial [Candidatus Eisenbacteria bacterium]|nr:hypothetical protein [Candidatus Eisenbacteria bacterium]